MKEKTIKVIYWIFTLIFTLFMLYAGISELMYTKQGNALLVQLGYPLYLNSILGISKILGVLALLQTRFKTIKEWAYAGFTIDMICAAISFAFIGVGVGNIISIIPFFVVMFISYYTWKKLNK